MRAKPKMGQIYFLTDSRLLYKDFGNDISQRLKFNAIILYNESDRVNNIKPVVGKFYYVEATNCLWLYDTRWILKIGNEYQYNTYTDENGYISPVINTDESITGFYGDKIIDNNGLLGNGAVVVRDNNRMTKGTIESNNIDNYLVYKSFQDNGMLFIPNGHLPYNDLSTSLGALHLTVDRNEINESLKLKGNAFYYGDWHNQGNIYIIKKITDKLIYPDYIPINDLEIVKFYIECSKTTTSNVNDVPTKRIIKSYFSIRPISNNSAYIHIISCYDDSVNSVVKNDLGELLFTHKNELIINETLECVREVSIDKKKHISKYILDKYDDSIIIEQEENNSIRVKLSSLWEDDNNNTTIKMDMWKKCKVLTSEEIEDNTNYIQRVI